MNGLSFDLVEESLVGELGLLGINYLARNTNEPVTQRRAPQDLLAALVQQPSSRVRTAVIAVLLAYPRFAEAMPYALAQVSSKEKLTLKFFYTAAVFLQCKYVAELKSIISDRWSNLPDLYGGEFNLKSGATPDELLVQLGQKHRMLTGLTANWSGTYENVAQHLLHRWEVERGFSTEYNDSIG